MKFNRSQYDLPERAQWTVTLSFVVAVTSLVAVVPYAAFVLLGLLLLAVFWRLGYEDVLIAAMLLLVFVPIGYMGVEQPFGRYTTPAVALLLFWAAKVSVEYRKSFNAGGVTLLQIVGSIAFLAVLGLSAQLGTNKFYSYAWITVAAASWLLPAILAPMISSARLLPRLRLTFGVVAIALGVIALSEYVFSYNPWSLVYLTEVDDRTYVVFRSKSSLGHPLTAMVVCTTVFIINYFSAWRTKHWFYWVAALFAASAIALTVSRTAIFALSAGLVVGAFGMLWNYGSSRRTGAASLLLSAFAVSVVWSTPLMRTRVASEESVKSSQYRSELYDYFQVLFERRPFLGFGPGTSANLFEQFAGRTLENSGLQALLSLGYVGSGAVLILLLGVIAQCIRNDRSEWAGAVVAFLVGIAGYNALDSNPALLALSGVVIVGGLAGYRERSKRAYGDTDKVSPAIPYKNKNSYSGAVS